MENSVVKAILERSSIRAYSDMKLTDDELSILKKAALSSPTAMNKQEQRFVFVTDPNLISALDTAIIDACIAAGASDFVERIQSRGGQVTYNAPLVVLICSNPARFSRVDAGIAVQNLAIAAKSIGLDSVILGMPDRAFSGIDGNELKRLFHFPDGYEFSIGIAIGHRAMDKEPHTWNESHIIEL